MRRTTSSFIEVNPDNFDINGPYLSPSTGGAASRELQGDRHGSQTPASHAGQADHAERSATTRIECGDTYAISRRRADPGWPRRLHPSGRDHVPVDRIPRARGECPRGAGDALCAIPAPGTRSVARPPSQQAPRTVRGCPVRDADVRNAAPHGTGATLRGPGGWGRLPVRTLPGGGHPCPGLRFREDRRRGGRHSAASATLRHQRDSPGSVGQAGIRGTPSASMPISRATSPLQVCCWSCTTRAGDTAWYNSYPLCGRIRHSRRCANPIPWNSSSHFEGRPQVIALPRQGGPIVTSRAGPQEAIGVHHAQDGTDS